MNHHVFTKRNVSKEQEESDELHSKRRLLRYKSDLWCILIKQNLRFSVDSKEGAKKKPWTDQELDLGDCSACRKDNYCNQTVTVNIDLKSVSSVTYV